MSACAKKAGHQTHLIDLRELSGWDDFRKDLKEFSPDVVAITMMSVDFNAALKAANIAGVKKVILTTRKHPNSFSGVEFVKKHFKLAGLKKDKLLFNGSAAQAVKYFPQNINVAALLGLAGIGMRKTEVRIIASPGVKKNIHEIEIESKAAKIFTRTENILHPQNPKTSFLAVLSAIATLKQILQPIKIGT